jgi:hypothetical protein
MDLEWALVEWGSGVVRLDKVDTLDADQEEAELYAVLAGKPTRSSWFDPRCLYIGKAYRQMVSKRVQQQHASYRNVLAYRNALRPGEDIVVMVGWIRRDWSSPERVSEAFVSDVEALLIYRNQPRCNTKEKDRYDRRRNLVVTNTGAYSPLKRTAACCTDHFQDWRGSRVATKMREVSLALDED